MRPILASLVLMTCAFALPAASQTPTPTPTEAPAAATPSPAAPAPAEGGLPQLPDDQIGGAYTFDTEHSVIAWSYRHMGFSTSHGLIRGVSGRLTLDPADPAASSVEAEFPLSAVLTVSGTLDEHIFGPDFLNGAAPATAVTFRSTAVQQTGPRSATVTGDLALNGRTAPVTLEVALAQVAESPVEKKVKAGFDITGTFKRSDFGLGFAAPAVSDEVTLAIAVEAFRD